MQSGSQRSGAGGLVSAAVDSVVVDYGRFVYQQPGAVAGAQPEEPDPIRWNIQEAVVPAGIRFRSAPNAEIRHVDRTVPHQTGLIQRGIEIRQRLPGTLVVPVIK